MGRRALNVPGGKRRSRPVRDSRAVGPPVCQGRVMAAGSLPVVRPMLATLGPLPQPPGWGYEFKWDGVRAVIYVDAGRVRVVSRNDREVTGSYPELRGLLSRFPRRRLVLDGEIVALDPAGAPSFSLLQQRMHVRTPNPALLARVPVRLYLFDVLHQASQSTVDIPYTRRRELLGDLAIDDGVASTPPWWADEAGGDLMRAAAELGLEGVVAKRLNSPYQPGVRSRFWVKTPLNKTTEVVIGGWAPGEGRRAGMIGSLLLGRYDPEGRLAYAGNVGTGFTHQALTELARQLRPLERDTSPFDPPVPRGQARHAHWVQPRLVGEVAFRTLTPDGHLRHPSWRGLRPDREPGEVRRD
jgi:bifunctional non-homologous end joining protein LigD